MINIVFKSVKKITFYILFILFFSISLSKAEIYDEIIVEGNERLSIETVIMFSGLKVGEDINTGDLNNAIKKLYKTNYFKDIKFSTKQSVIKISIIENPIIQSIKINGVKNKAVLNKTSGDEGIRVKSPIIGTAYLAPEPGAKKFVKVGDKIKKGQTVMIVEAMKTMNHVPSTNDGEVIKILVDDGQPVEFGQTLVVLK